MEHRYDVIVVGGGHAGIEASLASARMGCRTLLVTMDARAIGRMSCNPAIGGTAKGHMVREIDALGGEMGKIADATGIHFRMLNKSKGPAVWSPRSQNDRDMYSKEAGLRVSRVEGLEIAQDTLSDVVVDDGRVTAVLFESGRKAACASLVLCSGTFLNAVMHTGVHTTAGGRYQEPPSQGLTERFLSLGFAAGRLKTGTPPRLLRKSINFQDTEEQKPDDPAAPFSFQNKEIHNRQISMYLTYTNTHTHEVLRTGFGESPLFTGRIRGVGPRYCPSIEDKINRFAERERHQIFLEPEGYDSEVVYVNGFSSSLPAEVQLRGLRTISGLEQCQMVRPGYAVEYDFFPPYQVEHTLETKKVKGLFFAGQINGTSGYEEAAGQGIMAGINAACRARRLPPVTLSRGEAYIGVLIDDLINKGTEEPYRIFTSRAEYRLYLRQDNADSRLMRRGYSLGLISPTVLARLDEKEGRVSRAIARSKEVRMKPDIIAPIIHGDLPTEATSLFHLLRRPGVSIAHFLTLNHILEDAVFQELREDREAREQVDIEVKYEGYVKRQEEQIKSFERHEGIKIPEDFSFASIKSLSTEGREKLSRVRPRSIGQASRISGVTPADISVLMISLLR